MSRGLRGRAWGQPCPIHTPDASDGGGVAFLTIAREFVEIARSFSSPLCRKMQTLVNCTVRASERANDRLADR